MDQRGWPANDLHVDETDISQDPTDITDVPIIGDAVRFGTWTPRAAAIKGGHFKNMPKRPESVCDTWSPSESMFNAGLDGRGGSQDIRNTFGSSRVGRRHPDCGSPFIMLRPRTFAIRDVRPLSRNFYKFRGGLVVTPRRRDQPWPLPLSGVLRQAAVRIQQEDRADSSKESPVNSGLIVRRERPSKWGIANSRTRVRQS